MEILKELESNHFSVEDMTDGDLFLTNDTAYNLLPAWVRIPSALVEQLKYWQIKHIYTNGTGEVVKKIKGDHGRNFVSLPGDEKIECQKIKEFYLQLVQKGQEIIGAYKSKKGLMVTEIVDLLRSMVQALRERRRFLIRLSLYRGLSDDYFINHALQTTILSLVMGEAIKLPPHRLVDLGMATFLHEIGLLHLPVSLSEKDGPMTVEERRLLSSHVIVGYRSLKEFSLAQDILLGVLQHHERLDGSGYLQALSGDAICLYAKVIGIACAYHAQISDRPYRSAKNEHLSLAGLVKDMRRKYDEYLVNSLVSALSLFPIGSYVRLSDDSIARVVESDPENIRYPIVRIIMSPNGLKVGAEDSAIRLNKEYFVAAVLNQGEVDELMQAGQ